MSSNFAKLADEVNLRNWIHKHGRIGDDGEIFPSAYNEIVEKLVEEIKNVNRKDIPALKKIYVDIDLDSPAMKEEVFCAIVDELAAGNFANLEKFKFFIISYAQIVHVYRLRDYTRRLLILLIQLRINPFHKERIESAKRTCDKLGIIMDFDTLLRKVSEGDFTDIDKIIENKEKFLACIYDYAMQLSDDVCDYFSQI